MVIRRFASGARAVSGLRSFSSSAAVLAASLVVASAALAQNPPTDPKPAGETPAGPPYAPAHLEAEGLAPGFVDYMRRWKGFVDG
jgi:hypothetical protein